MQFKEYHTARPKRASEDNLRYIMQIKGVLENTEDPEERITLISNVNQELRGMEVSLATDKKASFVIEKIIKYSNRNQLRLFLAYCKRFTIHMFTQRYASHVMQTALEQASGFLLDKESKDEIITGPNGESIAELSSLICDIAHNIAPSFNDLICDSCSTHVVRILLCILCGYSSSYAKTKKHLKKGKASMNENHVFPSQFEGSLLELSEQLNELSLEDMEAILTNQYASPVIQLLLTILPSSSSLSLSLSILQISEEDNELSYAIAIYKNLIKHIIGARTLESLTPFLPNKYIIIIYKALLSNLMEYLDNTNANFVIQQFLACIYEKELVKQTYELLSTQLEEFYHHKKGVALQLFNACRRNEVYDVEISEQLKPLLLSECTNHTKDTTDPTISQIKNITEDELFIMNILGLSEQGGKILLNEKTCLFFYEYIQMRSPYSNKYISVLTKLETIQLLRLCLYLKGDIVYTMLAKYLKEKQDKTQFLSFIKGLKYEDSPVLRAKISQKEMTRFQVFIKKIRTEIKRSTNLQKAKSSVKRSHDDTNEMKTKQRKVSKSEQKEEEPAEDQNVEEEPKEEQHSENEKQEESDMKDEPMEEQPSTEENKEIDVQPVKEDSSSEQSKSAFKVPTIIKKLGFKIKN